MFTGIVQSVFEVVVLAKKKNELHYGIEFQSVKSLKIGASVAINGVCQSVKSIEGKIVYFDAIEETLRCTNLKKLALGDWINVERSCFVGQEIGGHILSGHVTGVVQIKKMRTVASQRTLWFELPNWLNPFLFEKGFIALNGVSLTVGRVTKELFCVHIIPLTWEHTNFCQRKVGDEVNVEIDSQTQVIVKTVERILKKCSS